MKFLLSPLIDGVKQNDFFLKVQFWDIPDFLKYANYKLSIIKKTWIKQAYKIMVYSI